MLGPKGGAAEQLCAKRESAGSKSREKKKKKPMTIEGSTRLLRAGNEKKVSTDRAPQKERPARCARGGERGGPREAINRIFDEHPLVSEEKKNLQCLLKKTDRRCAQNVDAFGIGKKEVGIEKRGKGAFLPKKG